MLKYSINLEVIGNVKIYEKKKKENQALFFIYDFLNVKSMVRQKKKMIKVLLLIL